MFKIQLNIYLALLLLGGILLSKNTFANNGIKEYCAVADSPDIDLIYPVSDPLDPTNFSSGLIDFQLPLNVTNSVQYDPLTNQYIFNSLLGDSIVFRNPSAMSLDDYLKQENENAMSDFWKQKLDEQSDYKYNEKDDAPEIKLPESKPLFGSDFVEIRPQGSAELSFGLNSSRTRLILIIYEKQELILYSQSTLFSLL